MFDTIFTAHDQIMDADRIPFLIAAIVLTVIGGIVTGPLAGNANPFTWGVLDSLCGKLGDRLDKKGRSSSDLMFRGLIFTLTLIIVVFVLAKMLPHNTSSYVEVFLVSLCLTSGSVWFVLLKLYFSMQNPEQVKGGYYSLSKSSRFNLNTTDEHGITRAGVSFAAVSFSTGLVCPAIWYLIGGLDILIIYSTLCFLSWRFGQCGFTKGFGKVPLALEKLLGYVPTLFAGFLFTAAASLTPTAKFFTSVKSWGEGISDTKYEEGGLIKSSIAWPLGITLGGAVQDVSGRSMKMDWVGPKDATAKISRKNLQRAIYINVIAHILFLLALLAAYLYAGKLL